MLKIESDSISISKKDNPKKRNDLIEQESNLSENSINNEYNSIDYFQEEDFVIKNYINLSFLEFDESINSTDNNQLNISLNSSKNNQIYNTLKQKYYFYYMNYSKQINGIYNINNLYQQKSIDKKYIINIMDIKTNKEKRTTIRMMNIPSYFKPLDLMRKIDEKFGISPKKENRIYNFIYIPLKDSNKNSGYAFINFVSPKHIIKFFFYFNGKKLKLKTSQKKCLITFADKQGAYVKNKGLKNDNNDNFMFFSDTKNHMELLTE